MGIRGHERLSLALTGGCQCGCHLEPVESKSLKEADRPLARRFLPGLRVSEFKALPSKQGWPGPWALGAAASSGAFETLCYHNPLSWPLAGSRPEKEKGKHGRGRLCAGLCVWFSLTGASPGLSFVFPHFNEKGDG